jgi:two-component system OmpR family sensor kinase
VIAHAGAGRLSLQWDRVDLVEVARDAVERIRPAAGERGIELVLTTCGDAPLVADRSQIAQLAETLLASTLAPTPPGGRIELGVQLHDGQASIDIVAPAGELGIPGSGLSLSVARAIAEAHGGTLELRSGPRTTNITVTVPTHIPAELELQEEAA